MNTFYYISPSRTLGERLIKVTKKSLSLALCSFSQQCCHAAALFPPLLYIHYTVHCKQYRVYHTFKISVHQKQTKGGNLCVKLSGDKEAIWYRVLLYVS